MCLFESHAWINYCPLQLIVHKTLLKFYLLIPVKLLIVIDHNILLDKFISNDASEHITVWSMDFLNDCKQFVKLVTPTIVGAGTPQDSRVLMTSSLL